MTRTENIRKLFLHRWPLGLVLIAFIIAKWHHLYYPFYWDESWSYAPGVRLMYNHGPSLMPNAIDVFYSRGHPLFFYAASAAWMHISGGYSHFNAHLYALLITLCLLITVYEVMLRYAGFVSAIVAIAALALHVGFFVQASAVMPEMLVALFSLIAVSAFAAKRFLPAGVALALLVFTKESGAVAALVLGIAAMVELFRKAETAQHKISGLLSTGIPVLLIGGFFLLQKHYLGWYLYPEHTGLIKLEWEPFYGKLHFSLNYLLAEDGPRWLVKGLILLCAVAAIRIRKTALALPAIPFAAGYLIARDKGNFLPEKLQFIILALVLAGTAVYYLRSKTLSENKKRCIVLSIAFIFSYLCFCCINFYTTRYLLAIIVPMMMVMAGIIVYTLQQLHPKASWACLALIIGAGWFMFRTDKGLGDMNLQSYNAMDVQDSTVHFLEGRQWFGKKIGTGSFQDQEHLKKPYTGFLHTPQVFRDVKWDMDGLTEVALFNNIEPDERLKTIQGDSSYHLMYRVKKGDAWAEIYSR